MTPKDLLTKARELAAAATPGPWIYEENHITLVNVPAENRTFGYGCGNEFVADLNDAEYHQYVSQGEQDGNGRFIAFSRTAVPALCDAVDRLTAENSRLRGALETIATTAHPYGSNCHCNGCRAKAALAAREEDGPEGRRET